MTLEEAKTMKTGDAVRYGMLLTTIISIKTSGMEAPYFRLDGVDGLTSYRLVS